MVDRRLLVILASNKRERALSILLVKLPYRQEIYTATTSLTSVPKPLKFLHLHYGTLRGYYEKMPDSDLKKLLADILSVLPQTTSAEGERDIIFPDELTEMLLPTINNLKNLELRIDSSAATSQQILDGFAWILPGLKTLSLTLGSTSKFIEFPRRG